MHNSFQKLLLHISKHISFILITTLGLFVGIFYVITLQHNFKILCPWQLNVLFNKTLLETYETAVALSPSNMQDFMKEEP